jgi:hypothetical protein
MVLPSRCVAFAINIGTRAEDPYKGKPYYQLDYGIEQVSDALNVPKVR